jgi:hypothetical protein
MINPILRCLTNLLAQLKSSNLPAALYAYIDKLVDKPQKQLRPALTYTNLNLR